MEVNDNVRGLATRLQIEPDEFIKILEGEEQLDKIPVKHYLSDERYKEIEKTLSKPDNETISKAINNNKEARWRKYRSEHGIESDHNDFEDYVKFLKEDYLTQEIEKAKKEAGGKPDERIEQLNKTIAELQGTLQTKDLEHEEKVKELNTQFAKRESNAMLKEYVAGIDIDVPDYVVKRGEKDAQDYVKKEHTKLYKLLKGDGAELAKDEDGKISILLNGETQVSEYKTPLDPTEVITNYAKEMNIGITDTKRQGRGGKDSKIKVATGLAKCETINEVMQYARDNDIDDRGDEMSKLINEWKKLKRK